MDQLDNNRPTFGRINFNMAYVNELIEQNTDLIFEEIYEICVHEITHALGFVGWAAKYWIDPTTDLPYGFDKLPIVTKELRGFDT